MLPSFSSPINVLEVSYHSYPCKYSFKYVEKKTDVHFIMK